eukprot:SM000426S15714  [mRNA]  locus=s426:29865:33512:+ [translate_table: standard]
MAADPAGPLPSQPASQPPSEGLRLRVVQWNVLADGLAQDGDFVRAPPAALAWSHRAPRLLALLLHAAPDLACLQELNHFDDYFSPELARHGYAGLFLPKAPSPAEVHSHFKLRTGHGVTVHRHTSFRLSMACRVILLPGGSLAPERHPALRPLRLLNAQRLGFPPDGCAILFRTDRFDVCDEVRWRYTGSQGQPHSQGALLCRLQERSTGRELVLATTHLKAKEGLAEERTRGEQAQELLQLLAERYGGRGLPIVLCGDFNATPDSVVYGLVERHPLQLASAGAVCRAAEHAVQDGQGGPAPGHTLEPEFTTWKFRSGGEKRATIDYVWVSGLRCAGMRLLPPPASVGAAGLPTAAAPSDHLMLACELQWDGGGGAAVGAGGQLGAGGGVEWRPVSSPALKALSGSLGGVVEACCLQPIDVIKTRLQLDHAHQYKGIVHCGRSIVAEEGVAALWKGLTPFATHLTLKYALRMGTNAVFQSLLRDRATGDLGSGRRLVAGFGAGVVEALVIVTPFEVVKIRLQQQRGLAVDQLKYRGPFHAVGTIVREEGLRGLWSGAAPTVLRNGTNQAVMFTTKNFFDTVVWGKREGDGRTLQPHESIISGFVAGFAGPCATGPFDVVKTRLMAQDRSPGVELRYRGLSHALTRIAAEEGILALWKGLLPRLMRIPPGQAIVWAVADQVTGFYERTVFKAHS